MPFFLPKKLACLMLVSLLFSSFAYSQDIVLEFCPVTKVQADKGFSATMNIRNNTGDVLDFAANKFQMEWPSLVSLPWPFSEGVQNGISWDFKINLDWPGSLAANATVQKGFNNAKYAGVLQFPTSGTYTQGGKTYTVGVSHCATTNPYELYDAKVEFDRDCFIESPKSNMCLGEGATEVWQGEGVFDVMFPKDRPSWAIGVMVAHRLFTNLAGVEMLSPNFWTATAMNESRMVCDPTIVPDQNLHWKINSGANTGTGIDTRTDNCFQVLNIGYVQISNNQPDLFAQSNAYGTASFNNVIANGSWETGALAVAAYHYQDIRYWNQIYCWNATKFYKNAQDPYAIEKIFYHAFHDGPNAGISLLNDIDANYNAAINAADMNDVISTGGTWSNLGGGSSRKVANFTSLLDGGDGEKYDYNYADNTKEYYGCYEESIKWSDIEFYIDKIKILYPHLMDAPIMAEIKAVFDGLNGGSDVMFSNLGPVIDEIVIQMGGHDPSSYLATQYGASKVCADNPIGVSLRTNDTICPGETAELQVWLAGDKNFRVDIEFPDGSINTFSGIDHSPYTIDVTDPGDYEIVYFEDDNEIGDINCNFAAITIESKNGSTIGWDKSNVDLSSGCATGDLIVTKNSESTETVTISYTLDGVAQTDVIMGFNETEKTLANGVTDGEYIITTISPNSCGTPINDTINFCGDCTKPQVEILTPDTAICEGDTAFVRFEFTGTADYTVHYNLSGIPGSVTGISTDFVVIPVWAGVTLTLDSLIAATCVNDTITNNITVTLNSIPVADLGNDTSLCSGNVVFVATIGGATYEWHDGSTNSTYTGNSTENIWVIVTENGCSDTDSVALNIGGELIVDLGNDTSICANDAPFELTVNNYNLIEWKDGLGGVGSNTTFNVTASSIIDVHIQDATGCEGWDTIVVSVNDHPIVELGNDTTICAADGALTLDADNLGADFLWEPGNEIIQTIDVTTTGEYKVEVTVDGCSTRDSITVTVVGSSILNLGPDTTFCSHLGDIVLDAGAGFTSYTWSNGALTQDITVNTSGTYDVKVEDANGCVGNDTIIVTINQTPTVDLGADTVIICATSPDVTLDAGNAGATFAWNSGEGSQTIQKGNTDAGDYWVLVTQNNCTASDTVNLTVATELTVDLGVDQDICRGTTLTLDAGFGAGFTFDWNNGGAQNDQTFIAGQGQVTVEVADAGGCSGRDTIIITEVNPLVIDLGLDQEICEGDNAMDFTMLSGRVDVTVVGWQDNSTDFTFSSDQAGTYWLEVDSSGCVYRDSVELTVNSLPVVDLGTDTFICVGTIPIITLTGGKFTSYQWADISGIPTPLGLNKTQDVSAIGTYALIATDINGCINGDSIEVTEEQGTQVGFAIDTTICPAGSATISVPNNLQGVVGASWAWFNDGSTGNDYQVSGEPDGTVVEVILDFTNEFGCVTRDTAVVRVDNNLPISLRDTAICEGEDITFASGYPAAGYTYNWQDASTGNDFSITGATITDGGNILVDVTSDEGCTGSANVILTINALPDPQLSAAPICLGEDRILDHGLTGVVSVWDHGEITNPITVTNQGLYRVTVTDANNCEDTVSVSLVVNTPPVLDLPVDQTLCDGESYALGTGLDDATHTHQWSDGSTATTADLSVKTDGQYIVSVTEDATNCSSEDTILFTFLNVPSVNLGNDVNICEGKSHLIESNETDAKYLYSWSSGEQGVDNITVNSTGEYSLIVTNGACKDTDSVAVTVRLNPISGLRNDTVVCFEDFETGLNLDPGRVGEEYLWSTGENTQLINIDQIGTYLVNITSEFGCETTDFVKIQEDCPAHVWLPNSFTPDGNSTNDIWVIRGRGIESVELFLFNRWGELIWSGNSIGDFWDGTYKGSEAQQDVYLYKLTYTYLNINNRLEKKMRVGRVALIR